MGNRGVDIAFNVVINTDIDDIRKAKCIETAFVDGLAMDIPPAPAINTPNRSGNRAVT